MKHKSPKVIVIELPKFNNLKNIKPKDMNKFLVSAGITAIASTSFTYASSSASITTALDPLVNVFQDLAHPVSIGFMTKGFLQMMAGSQHEGSKTIKYAVGGYLGIKFIPQIMNIIDGIKIGS